MALWFAYSEIRDRTGNTLVIPATFMQPAGAEPHPVNAPEVFKAAEQKAESELRVEQEYERSNFNRIMNATMRR
jgi:hypothetical protein